MPPFSKNEGEGFTPSRSGIRAGINVPAPFFPSTYPAPTRLDARDHSEILLVLRPVSETLKRIRLCSPYDDALRVGDPLDKNTDIGAINSRAQLKRICELVESGVAEGAQLVQKRCYLPRRGFWFPPSFFTQVTASHRIAREEIFGPVLSVMTFRTTEEAIERANNTPYGLSAGGWTNKGAKIFKIAARLRAGVIWANTYEPLAKPRRATTERCPPVEISGSLGGSRSVATDLGQGFARGSYNKFDPSSPFGGWHGLLAYTQLG
ncbi:MAG: aldehyde dehydrogenase family protein [Verrucomicrobia bacterium]|nr:aldehyde dehydrogenase family protein [Verrucomicrobiota bacterium]